MSKIRSHKGEIKRLYKITLDVLENMNDIPYYKIDNDGNHYYSYASIKPSIDDNEFFELMKEITVFTYSDTSGTNDLKKY